MIYAKDLVRVTKRQMGPDMEISVIPPLAVGSNDVLLR